VYKERLLRLADFLDGLLPTQLAMWTWVTSRDADGTIGGCGTVACAIGWACTIPEFQEAGLSFDSREKSPRFNGKHDGSAAAAFFGLAPAEVHHLFYPQFYEDKPTPRVVADRIRDVANGRYTVKQVDITQEMICTRND
jgi:hypothetical protein